MHRQGPRLFLSGQPYRFKGLNIYEANDRRGACPGISPKDGLTEPVKFDAALEAIGVGQNVFRSWFFQNMVPPTPVGVANDVLHTAGQDRDWSAFDTTLLTARSHNERVIVTLTNAWKECEGWTGTGTTRKIDWYQTGYRNTVDPGMTVPYREYVSQIVTRYASHPEILAWQMINEADPKDVGTNNCSENVAADALRSFADDISQVIKSIDNQHLVSIGSARGCGTGPAGPAAVSALAASNYQYVHMSTNVDLCEIHDYGVPYTPLDGPEHAHMYECAHGLAKPTFMGEAGISIAEAAGASTSDFGVRPFQSYMSHCATAQLKCRSGLFDNKIGAAFDDTDPAVGWLAWSWCFDVEAQPSARCYPTDLTKYYAIGPVDPVLEVLKKYPQTW